MNTFENISVVVCTYNRSYQLTNCLNSIKNQSVNNFEIIVIDDCSNDKTYDVANQLLLNFPQKKIHRNEQNMGLSYSRNIGAELASNEIVLFIDDDCIASRSWIEEMVKPFKDSRIGLTFGSIIDPPPINLAMVAAKGQYKRCQNEGYCDSVASGGGNMAVRRDIYLNNPINGYTLEDWELCHRVINQNRLIYYCPKASVNHEHYHNLHTLLKQRYRYGVGLTWFRRKFKTAPVNLQMALAVACLVLSPCILFFPVLMLFVIPVLFLSLGYLFIKDFRKDVKSLKECIVTSPLFLLIIISEFVGRLIGYFTSPKQINFGTDYLKKNRT